MTTPRAPLPTVTSESHSGIGRALPPNPPSPSRTLSIDDALELADDLIRELTKHIGDTDQLEAVFSRWLDVLDVPRFNLVCLAALRTTFLECLRVVPAGEWPADGVTLTVPTGDEGI